MYYILYSGDLRLGRNLDLRGSLTAAFFISDNKTCHAPAHPGGLLNSGKKVNSRNWKLKRKHPIYGIVERLAVLPGFLRNCQI